MVPLRFFKIKFPVQLTPFHLHCSLCLQVIQLIDQKHTSLGRNAFWAIDKVLKHISSITPCCSVDGQHCNHIGCRGHGQKTHLTFYNKGDEDVRKPEWLLLAIILPSELTNFTHLVRCQTSSYYCLFFFQPFLCPVCLTGSTVGYSLGRSSETECQYNCNNIFFDVLKLMLCNKVTVSCIMPMLADCVDHPCQFNMLLHYC